MFAGDNIALVDAHVALPGGIHLHVGEGFHAQLVGRVVFLQLVHGPAEAALDEGGRDGDGHHGQHQQGREDKERHRQPEQPQEDGRGGEQ